MIPIRQKMIGENKVEEWPDWDGISFVCINGRLVNETYDQAVKRLEGEK